MLRRLFRVVLIGCVLASGSPLARADQADDNQLRAKLYLIAIGQYQQRLVIASAQIAALRQQLAVTPLPLRGPILNQMGMIKAANAPPPNVPINVGDLWPDDYLVLATWLLQDTQIGWQATINQTNRTAVWAVGNVYQRTSPPFTIVRSRNYFRAR